MPHPLLCFSLLSGKVMVTLSRYNPSPQQQFYSQFNGKIKSVSMPTAYQLLNISFRDLTARLFYIIPSVKTFLTCFLSSIGVTFAILVNHMSACILLFVSPLSLPIRLRCSFVYLRKEPLKKGRERREKMKRKEHRTLIG